ncbi:MAG TPA: tripartite tricarboxylate transporter substrate binding protein [Candidatus Limnocylindria bacterium]|nr:tripartite tricarboxylate transporter substrate binding protein [Candidatus Limnocylindria bacterium]
MRNPLRRSLGLVAAVVIAACGGAAPAGSAPSASVTASAAPKAAWPAPGKTISLIVPYDAGGAGDVGARLLAPYLEKELGTMVEVVNKPGAGSQIGVTELSRAKPDGYTIGFTHLPATIAVYLDPERQAAFNRASLQPIAMYVVDPNAIAVKGNSPYKALKDLVDAAKANPGKVTLGDSGILSDGHITTLLLQEQTGAKFAVVHGAGGAKGIADLLGGHVQAQNVNLSGSNIDLAKSGEIRLLGIFDDSTNPNYPGVTTATSQGYKISVATSRAISAPAGTPKDVVTILSNAIKRAMAAPEFTAKAASSGLSLRYMDPTQLEAYWTDLETRVKPLIDLAKK